MYLYNSSRGWQPRRWPLLLLRISSGEVPVPAELSFRFENSNDARAMCCGVDDGQARSLEGELRRTKVAALLVLFEHRLNAREELGMHVVDLLL